jgi:hypothetical protein
VRLGFVDADGGHGRQHTSVAALVDDLVHPSGAGSTISHANRPPSTSSTSSTSTPWATLRHGRRSRLTGRRPHGAPRCPTSSPSSGDSEGHRALSVWPRTRASPLPWRPRPRCPTGRVMTSRSHHICCGPKRSSNSESLHGAASYPPPSRSVSACAWAHSRSRPWRRPTCGPYASPRLMVCALGLRTCWARRATRPPGSTCSGSTHVPATSAEPQPRAEADGVICPHPPEGTMVILNGHLARASTSAAVG